ncbi:UDP-N-acetylmuramate--L-alanine ligase [Polaribacter pacificus]|uniref:UDP-N-acetylmuramate--L-alanine ligase n=1 Tax=Polaribacter pacificus TaxID=1775173 RepID=A0A917HYG5_9FLAO|nr:UDP-N-acetylmuramate--L-alanine ligase [Polaribacter pacificus]GGG95645.1 UDP-N-acetylmuramate--L-alanine ligase [Polaribacter pacificus]
MNLKNIHNVYFIGAGGIGMSALARYFAAQGKQVAGYDKTSSEITESLALLGVKIHFDDAVANIPISFLDSKETLVVYTPAISKDNLELGYFMSMGYAVLKRSEVLGIITKNSFCLAVAGTHGKTTTSSILGHIMQPSGATAFLGGISENYQSNLILGADKLSVVEADEFDRSFLQLAPNIACITSMDADHLDIYKNPEALNTSFVDFSNKVTDTLIVAKGLPIKGLTYAIDEESDYRAFHVRIENGAYVFDVQTPTELICDVTFYLPGRHNIMNALAALAMADVYGIPLQQIKASLASFKGVRRRFSYAIKTDDLVLIDDYAHHPTEIKAVAKAVRELYPEEKVTCVFQPHLFSRTRDFIDDFAIALSQFDKLLLLDIYPAREEPIAGVNSDWLLEKVSLNDKKIVAKKDLLPELKKDDSKIVVMLGAGDIGVLITEAANALQKKEII